MKRSVRAIHKRELSGKAGMNCKTTVKLSAEKPMESSNACICLLHEIGQFHNGINAVTVKRFGYEYRTDPERTGTTVKLFGEVLRDRP
jgi:hypothetical protein